MSTSNAFLRFLFQFGAVFVVSWMIGRVVTNRQHAESVSFSVPPNLGFLTADQLAQYERDGFLVIPGFVPSNEISMLESRIESVIESTNMTEENPSVFSTDKQNATIKIDTFSTAHTKSASFGKNTPLIQFLAP
eukprot:GABV01001592.1.p2 GENE.GABV01001592.1~~GABV01001592.1.p2  ORF type:complete len:134 (-),score=52.80 GABV01001592.1:323-724(-)